MLNHVQLFATPWAVACQAPLSVGFSRQEYLEWVTISSSRGSSQPRDRIHISCWQPTLVLLPGKSHGQRILAGYSPWGRKESDMTEQLSTPKRLLTLEKDISNMKLLVIICKLTAVSPSLTPYSP